MESPSAKAWPQHGQTRDAAWKAPAPRHGHCMAKHVTPHGKPQRQGMATAWPLHGQTLGSPISALWIQPDQSNCFKRQNAFSTMRSRKQDASSQTLYLP
eukprot:206307-Chlamydomonas_euryale.AAC.9